MNQFPFLPRIFCVVALCLMFLAPPTEPLAAPADFNDLNEVLRVFSDSRLTRDLKTFGDPQAQATFTRTLENKVYKKVDAEVIKQLKSDPEFTGKRIFTHDFRTPGAKGSSVNTDRDVRILVEMEPNRWIEVPASKWQDHYYREFANRTGYQSDKKTPFKRLTPDAQRAETIKIRAHADRFRQQATDQFHMEASPDYSDHIFKGGKKDSSIRVINGPDGKPIVESLPKAVKVKAGEGLLTSAEGMAQMYHQKAWDQLGKAEEMAVRLKDKALPRTERTRLESQRQMHAAEGLVQMKKGLETIESVRTSYKKQGYQVGDLPENFRQAAEIVKAVNGTSRTDVDGVMRNLQEHGFRNPVELSENMKGQIESLKLASKKAPPTPPSTRLQKAGKVAGWAGELLSIDQRLQEAQQGRHIIEFLNMKKEDPATLALARKVGVAAVELLPVPVIDAVERGWRVDEQARANIEAAIRRGEADWTTHPAFVMFAAASTIMTETIASMTVDPLIAGAQAVKDGVLTVRDVGKNFLADFEHTETQRLQQQIKTAATDRAKTFGLGGLSARRGGVDGGPLVGQVNVGETISFHALKNDQWTNTYTISWILTHPDRQQMTLASDQSAAAAEANWIQFAVAEGWSPGTYTLSIQVFERATGLLVDRTEAAFTVSDQIGIGTLTATTGNFLNQGGKAITLPATGVKVGEALAFEVPRIGRWGKNHEIQWLLNGEIFKIGTGEMSDVHRLRFDSGNMAPGSYAVAVRLIDTSQVTRKILAHRQFSLKLVNHFLEMAPFAIRATMGDYDGPLLPAAVQNGDILAFQADLKHPQGKPEPAKLFWQVYNRAGKPLPGLGKEVPLLEAGTTRNYRFRIQLEDLADGDYTVGLTHLFSSDPERKTQATIQFRLSQAVRIDRILVTDNPDDQAHKPALTPDQEPLIYAHYTLGPGIGKATVTLTAKGPDGRVIETVSLERPRPGEKPPYRVGLALPATLIPIGVEITVEAQIVADNGKQHTASTRFQKEAYRLVLELPKTMKSGENKPFSITLPKSFQAPFAVDVRAAGRGFSVGHTPGSLNGVVSGIAAAAPEVGNLSVAVTDAAGKRASAQARVVIEPREERVSADPVPAAPRPPVPVYTPPPGPSPDPEKTHWVVLVRTDRGTIPWELRRVQSPPGTRPAGNHTVVWGPGSRGCAAVITLGERAMRSYAIRDKRESTYTVTPENIRSWGQVGDKCESNKEDTTAISSAPAPPPRMDAGPPQRRAADNSPSQKSVPVAGAREWLVVRFHYPEGSKVEQMWHKQNDWSPRLREMRHDILYGPCSTDEAKRYIQGITKTDKGHPQKSAPTAAMVKKDDDQGKKSAFRNEAVKRLVALNSNLEQESRRLSGDMSVFVYAINNLRAKSDKERAALNQRKQVFKSAAGKMTKKQFDALHGAAYRVLLADGEAFNKRLREQEEKVQTLKKIYERRKAVGELHNAIANAVRLGAVDKAVSLANGSTLAQEFGYKPLLN